MTLPGAPVLFEEFVRRLRERLSGPLPGPPAQLRMAPRPRSSAVLRPDQARRAAVLALFVPGQDGSDGAALLLTQRSQTVERHQGQICLPGGVLDPGETPEQAARREVEEELGIPRDQIQVLGAMTSLYIPVSGFAIQPLVGAFEGRATWNADPHEVDEVLEIGLSELLDPQCVQVRRDERDGWPAEIPYFAWRGKQVWGATAMMLSELRELCQL